MAYTKYRAITVDYTKVPNSDQSNFPVLISGTYSYLATTGNGGDVENANGYDVAFFSDSGLTTQLSHETASYNATTGAVVYWVKIPTLSYTSDTTFYMAYGDSSISVSQENITDTWSNGFTGVYHMDNGTTLSPNDSSSSANHGTNTGGISASTTAVTNGGAYIPSTAARLTSFGSSLSAATNDRTVSIWIKPGSTSRRGILGTRPTTAAQGWALVANRSTAGNLTYFHLGTGGVLAEYAAGINTSTFKRVGVTWDYSATTAKLYADGSYLGSATGNSDPSSTYNGGIGTAQDSATDTFTGGYLDECFIANVVRSDDWMTTEFNSLNSPSTFYSVGTEQVPSTTGLSKFVHVALADISKIFNVSISGIAKVLRVSTV